MDKVRTSTKIEIEKLKNLIQSTARVSNPIGKLMDYVQEDIDTMVQEFKKYKTESRLLDESLAEEKEYVMQMQIAIHNCSL